MGTPPYGDSELDRLLTGHPQPRDLPDELDVFVHDLRAAYPAAPLGPEDRHVAAITEAYHLIADKGDPVVRPASNADAPAPQVSWLPKRRRTDMKGRMLKPILTKGLAPVFALVTIFSGMAYAGVLPTPVQNAVEGLVGADDETAADPSTTDDLVEDDGAVEDEDAGAQDEDEGDVNDGDHQGEDESDVNDDDQGEDGDHQGEDEGDVNDDDQGEDGDHQGEDADHQGEDDDDSDEDADDDADDEDSGSEEDDAQDDDSSEQGDEQ